MKKIFTFIFLVVIAGILVFPNLKKENLESAKKEQNAQLKISTSFYPLYFLTKEIVGDQAEVINLTKTGVEPHDYEPSTGDIREIEDSQLLIVTDDYFETWLQDLSQQIGQDKTQVLKAGAGLASLQMNKDNTVKTDPHIWLDPTLLQKEAEAISNKLQTIDPRNAELYQSNTQILLSKLNTLDQEFKTGLAHCQKNKVITSHAAFAYMAKRYGFEQIAIQGLNAEEDPSPAEIASIVKLAKANEINYVFFETLLSPKISETIAKEIGGQTLIFNPIEGLNEEEKQSGADYFSIQKENLNNLRLALNCQ